ncbi:MAG: thioredoxin-disulfide reductase [Candidatus Nitrosocaldus sp.]|nr:thioredoxin-disulfide reductase [Candidatus Nitrosocaldus sp.]MDW7999573.1 thioredoxin-disulfide reductase [Candidatus Nitrosocaldus sp.]
MSNSMYISTASMEEGRELKDRYSVIILGSGPAGLTAAIYTARAKLDTLVVSGDLPGGQLMNTGTVENFPGFPHGIFGPELMMNMRAQAERFGATILDDIATSVEFTHNPFVINTVDKRLEADAVIIATGASPRKLGLKSEERFAGKGVSYCATCDGPFFKGEDIVVVGGGDSAVEEALFLTKFANRVQIVHRRDRLRASKILQERAFTNPKVSFVWNSVVEDILGDRKVNAVLIRDITNDKRYELKCGGIFIAIGHEPNTRIFKGQIDMDEHGYIKVRDHTKTNVDGVFVAGDVHDPVYRQAVTAAGFGCMAALDVERYLAEKYHNGR